MISYILRCFQRIKIPFILQRKLSLAVVLVILTSVLIYNNISKEDYSKSIDLINVQISSLNQRIESWKLKDQSIENAIVEENPSKLLPIESIKEPNQEMTPSNAVIVIITKNSRISDILKMLHTLEHRLSFKHDYALLVESTPSKELSMMAQSMVSSTVHFVNIHQYLRLPEDLDRSKVKHAKDSLKHKGIKDTRSSKTKHIQRFNVLEMFNLEVFNQYEYFWQLNDAKLELLCSLKFDPIEVMSKNNKIIGFEFFKKHEFAGNLEYNIWENVLKYIDDNPREISNNNFIDLISNDKAKTYNGCELKTFGMIGKLKFFKSNSYQKLAKYLLEQNGIYLNLWSDSAIYTIAASLLLSPYDFQFFQNLGFSNYDLKGNSILRSCPIESDIRINNRCICNPINDNVWEEGLNNGCLSQYFELLNFTKPNDSISLRKELIENQERQKSYELEQLEIQKQLETMEIAKLLENEKDESLDQSKQDINDQIIPNIEQQIGDVVERYERYD
ncbi:hypothetical protein WICMUC_005725 [Wickerhamomyces mucosus]|uniref:Uncharacterized protein n=1 Tax=Wickerhamomyces mucosus TaxID=1378264 RepID=A0A9P8T3T6_9ASCO|nr:hypothetical protein WICMUC_005725 [Wickerhamomyces mucosus]